MRHLGPRRKLFLLRDEHPELRRELQRQSGPVPPVLRPQRPADAQLVAFQSKLSGALAPFLNGTVAVGNSTSFYGWDSNIMRRLFVNDRSRLDLLVGYRYLRLDDSTTIVEDALSVTTTPADQAAFPPGVRFRVFDQFSTTNYFNGGQIGLVGEHRWGRWVGGFRALVALGDTHEQVKIIGSTQFTDTSTGATSSFKGGLLALPSNIGVYNFDQFSTIAEVGLNLGYQVTRNVRVFGGYTFLNWSGVARSGDQIDTTVNPTHIPNAPVPPSGPNQPAFHLNQTNFYAHGYNIGLQLMW